MFLKEDPEDFGVEPILILSEDHDLGEFGLDYDIIFEPVENIRTAIKKIIDEDI